LKKAVIASILILSMTIFTGQTLAAQPDILSVPIVNEEDQRFTLIVSIRPSLSVSGKTASYSLSVNCVSSVNSISVVLQIQQLVSGKWVDYGTSWTVSAKSSYLFTNGTRTVVSGSSYRIKATVVAKSGNTSERTTVYS